MKTRRETFALAGLALPGLVLTAATNAQAHRRRRHTAKTGVHEQVLDGHWQAGLERHYDRVLKVPGLATDPAKPTPGTLWYRREVTLPAGGWTRATLTLKGARFAPEVYVDGIKVSASEGGMAATVHRFVLPKLSRARTIVIEIALASLDRLDPKDASAVPGADRWRNNVSSYLWDSVVLRLHGEAEIVRVLPTSHIDDDSFSLSWDLDGAVATDAMVRFQVLDTKGHIVADSGRVPAQRPSGATRLALDRRVATWGPDVPNLYTLRSELYLGGRLSDAREQNLGLREFSVKGLGFDLNGAPCRVRMGTVVWHRWTRDPEAAEIAFDPHWFETNVILPLKRLGANALRFHLGLPPEALLDLCDRHGLLVQMEWPFFHGIAASRASMETQWRAWLDTAARHPSIVIMHPWNETGGDQLKPADAAIDALRPLYPPLVMSHRELTPIHKYWWSLFENLGLYYDSAAQFGQAVMVDEFGGDYLDKNGDPGLYPTTRETFLRFLGRDHTRDERLQLQCDANARVAEYWRRLDVAGFSPFCIVGSREDGSNWYMGPTEVPVATQKPVWNALSAAFAQSSLSLEIWNRNFTPAETVTLPLWLFNESGRARDMRATVHIVSVETGIDAVPPLSFSATVAAHGLRSLPIQVAMPPHTGEWRIEARLAAPGPVAGIPVVSSWRIRTFVPKPSPRVAATVVGIAADEHELRELFARMPIRVTDLADPAAELILGGRSTWARLSDPAVRGAFEAQMHKGRSILLLDAGPQPLGVGYSPGAGLGGPLEGAPSVSNPAVLQDVVLFGGVRATFAEMAEPESTIQPPVDNRELWSGIPKEATWLWNGLRGGLIVPAADMQVSGLNGKALIATWQARGAEPARIANGDYFAYELAGYYAFAGRGDDKTVSDALRQRVKFLVEDAPALANVVNPNAPVTVTDLHKLYAESRDAQAESLMPLANAGKGLSRVPVVKISYGPGKGRLVLSQLLTAGRLTPGVSEAGPGVYGLRYDPVAEQAVLNLMAAALS